MLKKILFIARTMFFLAAVAYVVYRIAVDFSKFDYSMISLDPILILLALVLGLIHLLPLPSIWVILLKRAGKLLPGKLLCYYAVWFHSMLCKYVPGKALLVAERLRLGSRYNIDVKEGTIYLIMEQLMFLIGCVFFVPLGLVFAGSYFTFTGRFYYLFPIIVLAFVALLPNIYRYVAGLKFMRPFGFDAIEVDRKSLLYAILLSMLFWTLYSLFIFVQFELIADQNFMDFFNIVFWVSTSYLVGYIVLVAPAGIGVREAALIYGLSMKYPQETATMMAVLARGTSTLSELVMYILFNHIIRCKFPER